MSVKQLFDIVLGKKEPTNRLVACSQFFTLFQDERGVYYIKDKSTTYNVFKTIGSCSEQDAINKAKEMTSGRNI